VLKALSFAEGSNPSGRLVQARTGSSTHRVEGRRER
jgi:hypothetical protein